MGANRSLAQPAKPRAILEAQHDIGRASGRQPHFSRKHFSPLRIAAVDSRRARLPSSTSAPDDRTAVVKANLAGTACRRYD